MKFYGGIIRTGSASSATKEAKDRATIAREICSSIGGIVEECRTARYYYLSEGLLQENPNLEIEGDKKRVTDSLQTLGFDPVLTRALRKAEDLYKPTSDGFDLKSCIGFLRSFLERLHVDAARTISSGSVVDEWDPSTTYLKNNKFLTPQQDKFARGIWALVSDEGVHPIMAEREFCRVTRNMTIEYGLMFLTVLEKKGVKISSVPAQTGAGRQP